MAVPGCWFTRSQCAWKVQIHFVGFLYAEGGIPFGEIPRRHVGAQIGRTVDVHLQQQGPVFGLCLLAPDSCPVAEVFLEGNTFGTGHDIQCDGHTAIVGDVLADGELAVANTPGQLNAVELLDHGVYLLVELPLIGLGPPVVQVAQLVALGAVGVEGV